MPNKLSILILQTLSENFNKHFTLEELASIVNPSHDHHDNLNELRMSQAEVLDELLLLDNQGLIELNANNDQSFFKSNTLNKKIVQLQICYRDLE